MTRKQHWVPRFYLRHFTSSSGHLHAYRIKGDGYFISSPEDVCSRRDLYEVKHSESADPGDSEFYMQNLIENRLSESEGRLALFYSQIIECCTRREFEGKKFLDGRLAACFLAANLIVRHPEGMRADRAKASVIAAAFLNENLLSNNELAMLDQTKWRNDVNALAELAIESTLLFSDDSSVPINRIFNSFCSKHFTVLKAPLGTMFVTTSMPMFVIGPEDVSYDFDIAYMPLSNECAAFFCEEELFPSFLKLDLLGAAYVNQLMLLNCQFWEVALAGARGPLERSVRDWKMASFAQ